MAAHREDGTEQTKGKRGAHELPERMETPNEIILASPWISDKPLI